MAQIGDRIGNYRLVEILDGGAFGQVFRAEHILLAEERQAAIKFLRLERQNNQDARERFRDEARILNQLQHLAILPIQDFGLDKDDVPYITTNYAAGGTLRTYLKKRAGKPLDLAEALRIIVPIGQALQYAHDNGIIHSDIKPENILFSADNRPLLADFGIAVVLTTNSTDLGNGGTAPYMAPEQFNGEVSKKSDQYALGCLLYEMLAGQRPFGASNYFALREQHLNELPMPPQQINPQIPDYVNAAILRALTKDRSERYESISAFLDTLRTPLRVKQPTPPHAHQPLPQPATQPPALPKPRIPPNALIQPVMPPAPPTPHVISSSLLPPIEKPAVGRENTSSSPGANVWRNDNLAPPLTPRQPPGGESIYVPRPLLLGQQVHTPRPGGNGKLSAGQNDSSGKIPALIPVNVVPAELAPAPGGTLASAPTNTAPSPLWQHLQRSRGRKRLLLLLLLLLITLLIAGGVAVSALGGFSGLASLGPLTATITITPRSQVVQNNYLISGVTTAPDAAQCQVSARVLTAQSNTQQATGNATGSIAATRATGQLIFLNITGSGITIAGNGQTILTGANGVQVTFNEIVFVPATGNASALINDAYAIQPGTQGNIPAFDISESCCVSGISVKNTTAFHGGMDAQSPGIVQQSDIDGAAQLLITQLTRSTQATLAKQAKSNERVVDGSFQCKPTTTADHKAGDRAPSVTVSASVACSEEVFDLAAAQQMASGLLTTNPQNNTNLTGYKLVPPIIASLVGDSVVKAPAQVGIQMQAAGKWVYQFIDLV